MDFTVCLSLGILVPHTHGALPALQRRTPPYKQYHWCCLPDPQISAPQDSFQFLFSRVPSGRSSPCSPRFLTVLQVSFLSLFSQVISCSPGFLPVPVLQGSSRPPGPRSTGFETVWVSWSLQYHGQQSIYSCWFRWPLTSDRFWPVPLPPQPTVPFAWELGYCSPKVTDKVW